MSVAEDFTVDEVTPSTRADFTGDDWAGSGGGAGCAPGEACLPNTYIDPSTCPPTTHDYEPWTLDADPADPDTVILATTPFAYYLMDDASGNPQDSSGNGNHASSVVANVSYAQAPLSTKVGNSIFCVDGFVIVPPPRAHLSNHTEDWSLAALFKIESLVGGHNGAGADGIYCLLGQDESGNTQYGLFWNSAGAGYAVPDGLMDIVKNDTYPKMTSVGPVVVGQTVVLIIRAFGVCLEYWVNGALIGTSWRLDDSTSALLGVGGSTEGTRYWDACQTRWSNVATWQRAITYAEVKSITEALADAAIFAAAWTP